MHITWAYRAIDTTRPTLLQGWAWVLLFWKWRGDVRWGSQSGGEVAGSVVCVAIRLKFLVEKRVRFRRRGILFKRPLGDRGTTCLSSSLRNSPSRPCSWSEIDFIVGGRLQGNRECVQKKERTSEEGNTWWISNEFFCLCSRGMPGPSLCRILHGELHLHPYKRERDYVTQQTSCKQLVDTLLNDALEYFSNQAHFHYSGCVNKQNAVLEWKKSQGIFHGRLLNSDRVTVYCAISRVGIIDWFIKIVHRPWKTNRTSSERIIPVISWQRWKFGWNFSKISKAGFDPE